MSEEQPTQDQAPEQPSSSEPPPYQPDPALIAYLEKGRDPEGTKAVDSPSTTGSRDD